MSAAISSVRTEIPVSKGFRFIGTAEHRSVRQPERNVRLGRAAERPPTPRTAPHPRAATTRERCPRSSGAPTERRILEELDREPALADEELRRGDVDRPSRLQAADRIDPSSGEVAERERKRPHHADAMRDPEEPGNAGAIASVVVPSSERISIVSFGPGPSAARRRGRRRVRARRPTPRVRRSRRRSRSDVVHRVAVRDREREREERNAALRVHRAVDRVDDDAQAAAAAERPHAELLRDERQVEPERVEASTTASSAAASIAVVSSPPSPRARTGSRSTRVGSSREHVLEIADAVAAELEPVGPLRHGSSGWKRSPDRSFGKK